jgi:hypothetical protein
MNDIIVLFIALLIIGGIAYTVMNRRQNAAASRSAVIRSQQERDVSAPVVPIAPSQAAAPVMQVPGPAVVEAEPDESPLPIEENDVTGSGEVESPTELPGFEVTANEDEEVDTTEIDTVRAEAVDGDEGMPADETAVSQEAQVTTGEVNHAAIYDDTQPQHDQRFAVTFDNGHKADIVRVSLNTEGKRIAEMLNLSAPQPVIFITGGAGYMSDDDKHLTMEIIRTIAEFAERQNAVVIDGGTESGIMQMIGDARKDAGYAFPLVGVAPMGKVSFPGYRNPKEEAYLEDSHSHFVLVDGEDWGVESEVIIRLTRSLSNDRRLPAVGVLINGGKIASQEVYLAVSKQLPMLILEGSGRFADEVATAFKTGKANQRIIQAILSGGDIQIVSTVEGPDAMRKKLEARFL